MKTIKLKIVCRSCGGTGLYSGMAEHDGAAVVCHTCEGTGCDNYEFDYEDFIERKPAKKVKRVYEANPGIGIGEDPKKNLNLEDFGGIPYKDWKDGKPFPRGSEMRKYTCPMWWYQSTDYEKKPHWNECQETLGGYISTCKYFGTKEKCWKRFDDENPE